MKKLLVILVPLIFIAALFFHRSVTVEKIRVIDGDTFTIGNKTIRLEGIDAPELGQAYGREATFALTALLGDPNIVDKSTDFYGRAIAKVYVNGEDVSLFLLRQGLAWHYKAYSSSTIYALAETQAKLERIGIWSDPHPVPPWEYRNR